MAHTKFPGCALLVHPTYPNMPKSCAKLVHQEHASITTIDEMQKVYIYIYTYTLALFFSFWCSLPLNLTCLFLAVAQFSTFLGDCASIMFKLHTQTHTHTHESLWYCDLMILWDFETVMLGFYEPMILWYSDTVVLFFLLSIFLYETTRRPQDERTAGTDEPKA